MKKAIKKMTVFLCTILGAALFVLAGCSEEQTFVEKTYDSGDSAIESVEIDVTDRELQIEQAEDGEVHIYYHDSQKEYLEIGVSDDKKLSVKLTMDKDWTDFIGVKPSAEYRKIRICIPQGVVLSLSATTTNEAIKATGLSVAGSLSLNSPHLFFRKLRFRRWNSNSDSRQPTEPSPLLLHWWWYPKG